MKNNKKIIKKSLIGMLIVLIFTIGAILRIHNLMDVPSRSPDEEVYIFQARTVVEHGMGSIKLMMHEYNRDSNMQLYPSPSRVGYLWLLSGVMKLIKAKDARAGVYISCFFSIAALLLLIAAGLRFFNSWITLCALLFMSASPMALTVTRRVWQESMLVCLGFFLVYAACEIKRASNKIFWYILLVLVGSYCVMIKMMCLFVFGLCVGYLLWILCIKEKSFYKARLLVILSMVGLGVSLFIISYFAGGFQAIVKYITITRSLEPKVLYAAQCESGPWYQFIEMLWMLEPVSTILFFIGITGVFLSKANYIKKITLPIIKDTSGISWIVFFTIAYMVALFIFKEHTLNLRFVSFLYIPFYLLSGLGLWCIISLAKKAFKTLHFYLASTIIAIIIITSAFNNYHTFNTFISNPISKDLSIRILRDSLKP